MSEHKGTGVISAQPRAARENVRKVTAADV